MCCTIPLAAVHATAAGIRSCAVTFGLPAGLGCTARAIVRESIVTKLSLVSSGCVVIVPHVGLPVD